MNCCFLPSLPHALPIDNVIIRFWHWKEILWEVMGTKISERDRGGDEELVTKAMENHPDWSWNSPMGNKNKTDYLGPDYESLNNWNEELRLNPEGNGKASGTFLLKGDLWTVGYNNPDNRCQGQGVSGGEGILRTSGWNPGSREKVLDHSGRAGMGRTNYLQGWTVTGEEISMGFVASRQYRG